MIPSEPKKMNSPEELAFGINAGVKTRIEIEGCTIREACEWIAKAINRPYHYVRRIYDAQNR